MGNSTKYGTDMGIHMPLQQQHRFLVYTLNAQHSSGTIRAGEARTKGVGLFIDSLPTLGRLLPFARGSDGSNAFVGRPTQR